jgi:hypothetical protein
VNVNVTEPADTPVITPALVTVATAGLLLVHVPPLVGDNVAVLPTHTDAGAVTTGKAFTVTTTTLLKTEHVNPPDPFLVPVATRRYHVV